MRVLLAAVCAVLLPSAAMAAHPTVDAADRQFVDRAHSINQGEIELGKLAQRRGTTPEVRELGRRMVKDHTAALDQLRVVGRQNDLSLPHGVEPEEAALHARLSRLTGPAFDRAYVEHMVSGHQEAIGLFEEELHRTRNPALRFYAVRQLPILRTHEMLSRRALPRA